MYNKQSYFIKGILALLATATIGSFAGCSQAEDAGSASLPPSLTATTTLYQSSADNYGVPTKQSNHKPQSPRLMLSKRAVGDSLRQHDVHVDNLRKNLGHNALKALSQNLGLSLYCHTKPKPLSQPDEATTVIVNPLTLGQDNELGVTANLTSRLGRIGIDFNGTNVESFIMVKTCVVKAGALFDTETEIDHMKIKTKAAYTDLDPRPLVLYTGYGYVVDEGKYKHAICADLQLPLFGLSVGMKIKAPITGNKHGFSCSVNTCDFYVTLKENANFL